MLECKEWEKQSSRLEIDHKFIDILRWNEKYKIFVQHLSNENGAVQIVDVQTFLPIDNSSKKCIDLLSEL